MIHKLSFLAVLALLPLTVHAASRPQLLAAPPTTRSTEPRPPIAIGVSLPEPGYVTLVIEDASGRRVRNLISETPLPAGEQIVYWDGLDDLARDTNAASHGSYHVPGKFVEPATYTVRGLYRKALDIRYEFSVYNPGLPPWKTGDTGSEWFTNHTPPSAACFIPAGQAPDRGPGKGSPAQVLVGSFVAEGGSGLAWLNLDGKKLHGQMWIGGIWTGAQRLCRDMGDKPVDGTYAYTASAWKGDKYNNNQAELRLHKLVNDSAKRLAKPRDGRLGFGEDPRVLEPTWKFPDSESAVVADIAAYDGLVVASLPKLNQLLLVDAARSKAIGTAPLEKPAGVAFLKDGTLLAISGTSVVRTRIVPPNLTTAPSKLDTQVVISQGLEEPMNLTTDSAGNIYVSDHGKSHQVKVFSADGKFVRAIGTAGAPHAGPYDPNQMHRPAGLTIDDRQQLWVAEDDHQPKRLSIWSLDGKLIRAYYGPPPYGGGGALDPQDKSLFYLGGMTFKLNWETGQSTLIAIHHRATPDEQILPGAHGNTGEPETAYYLNGTKYFTNCFNSNPTSGTHVVTIWKDVKGLAVPVAAFGEAKYWSILAEEPLVSRVPAADAKKKQDASKPRDLTGYLFVWSDTNGDGRVQPDELKVIPGDVGSSAIVAPDLSLATATGKLYRPISFTAGGAPVYDIEKPQAIMADTQRPGSSGGGQVLLCPDGNIIFTTAPKPFHNFSLGGGKANQPMWSYPSLWPGLHASHIAPPPSFPGELLGTTRLLGPAMKNPGEGGDLWAINGNKGNIYLFTSDGLFVATLFHDCREPAAAWSTRPSADRGMSVADLTNGEESFWPSITRTADGSIYIVSKWPAIMRVDGLATIQTIAPQSVTVTPQLLAEAQNYFQTTEAQRQAQNQSDAVLTIALRKEAPKVDGDLPDWPAKSFVTIDTRLDKVGDWGKKKVETQAALAVAGDRLYAAFKTGDPKALDNSAAALQNLFKTGGALDLMLRTNPGADGKGPAAGDLRLLVCMTKDKPVAVLYRAVVPGYKGDGMQFSSPLRTVKFDQVQDVSDQVTVARGTQTIAAVKDKPAMTGPSGDFELSIPLSVLGFKPQPGEKLRGDIGVLRGTAVETTQRAYWFNKATGITSDIPSEAELTPRLWGTLVVQGQ